MTPRRTTDNTKALEAFLTAKTEIGMSAELCRAAIDSE